MRLLMTMMLLFTAAYPAGAEGACVSVPRGAQDPAVKACESYTSYAFTITGSTYTYSRSEYRTAFSELLRSWLAQQDVTWATLPASVDFWLAVPEANPEATQARAVVRIGDQRFVLFLSVHPQDWQADELSVGVLPKGESYPETYGYRVGSLLVKKQDERSDESLHQYMETKGAGWPQFFSPGWFDYAVPAFQEQQVNDAVLQDQEAAAFVARTNLNYILEWIALRERVFTFSLPGS